MAKWKQHQRRPDPDAEWQAIVAAMLPEAQQRCDALVASWNGVYPELPSKAIHRQVTVPILEASYGPDYLYAAAQMLTETLYKPVLKEMLRHQREVEKAAESLVDRNRPEVDYTVTHEREVIGSFCIITRRGDSLHAHDQVLVCIASSYNPGDAEMNEEPGYYNSYAEPNDAEKQLPEFQRLAAKIADDRAYAQHQQQVIEERRQADLDAIRATGKEPTTFQRFFAGMNDN